MPTKDKNRILVTKATKGRMSGSTVEKEISNAAVMLHNKANAVSLKVDDPMRKQLLLLDQGRKGPQISNGLGITLGMMMIQKSTNISKVNT
jgi:hypothetical protein